MQQRLAGTLYDTRHLTPAWLWHNGTAPDAPNYQRVIAYGGTPRCVLWVRTGRREGAYDGLVLLDADQAAVLHARLLATPVSLASWLQDIGEHVVCEEVRVSC